MRPALFVVAVIIAFVATFLLWEAAYAALVAYQTHRSALWIRFAHGLELSLPAQSVFHEWETPLVRRIAGQATLAALVSAMITSMIVSQIIQAMRSKRAPGGGSRLAGLRDLEKGELLNGRPGYSIFLGRFNGKDVRYSGPSHIYVNGPTRSGKGVGFVLPNALEWRGSLIGLDIKKEMWTEIGAARAALGQRVFMFAPGSPETHAWNPLDLVGPWPERATDVTNIAHSLIATPASGDSYWAETSRGLFAGLLGYVLDSETMEGCRTIKSALKMMSRGRSLAVVMAEALAAEPNLNEFVKDKFRQHIGREDKQRMSFEAHIVTALDAWNNRLIDDATGHSDFNIADLRRNPFTLLIGTPVGNFGSVEAVVRLLVQQVHDVLLKALPGVDEPHRLLLMLDEFYQFGRMPEIVDRAPLVAGYGFQIAIIAQGLTQLDARYTKPIRDMLIGNTDVKLLIGVGDETTAKYCSDEIGRHYVKRENWGTSIGGGALGGTAPRANRTIQLRWELEPIITTEALRRLDPGKAVLLVRGQHAAMIDKINFFTDTKFKRRVAEAAPFKSHLHMPEAGRPSIPEAPPIATSTIAHGAKHDAALARVLTEAETVFVDATALKSIFIAAMNEASNEPVAELCRRLRTHPASISEVKKPGGLFARREPAEVLTRALRAEIVAARHLLNADRAERAGAGGDTVVGSVETGNVAPAVSSVVNATPAGNTPNSAAASPAAHAQEPADLLTLIAKVDERGSALMGDATAHIAESLDSERRAAFEAELATFTAQSELFRDTPDDLEAITAT